MTPWQRTAESTQMKTIIYFADGSIEATNWADKHVASGIARFATPQEIASYEQHFERCDAAMHVS